jgi:hypothetical protein
MVSTKLAVTFIVISLIVNVIVAGACSILLFINFTPFTNSFGDDTTARQILSCIYLSIATISFYALARSLYQYYQKSKSNALETLQWVGWGLFPIQIVYKLLTVVIVLDKKAPVIWVNLAIAILHSISLFLYTKKVHL